jgi:undecaprenyl-diphosphatase
MLATTTSHAAAIYHMSFLQAIVLGLIQGIYELFPLSSLGHTVLIPSWIGGSWALLVKQESRSESPYLAFIVALHLANAIALVLFYIKEWVRLIAAFFRSLARRRIDDDTERLAWLIVIATIPVGILGLLLEHTFRTLFAKPLAAALFLTVNGVILAAGARYRRRSQATLVATPDALPAQGRGRAIGRRRDESMVAIDETAEHELNAQISWWSALCIGAAQTLALFAGISREGVAMVGGLSRGLSNENAMRFAFLLSAPVIFAAGALKVPDLTGPLGNGIRGQAIAGAGAAVLASLAAIFFLSRYFKNHTLRPFAVYSLLFGIASIVRFGLF